MSTPVFASVETTDPCGICRDTVEDRTYCFWCDTTVCANQACSYVHWGTCQDARHATGNTEDRPVQFRVVSANDAGFITATLAAWAFAILIAVTVPAVLCFAALTKHPLVAEITWIVVGAVVVGWMAPKPGGAR